MYDITGQLDKNRAQLSSDIEAVLESGQNKAIAQVLKDGQEASSKNSRKVTHRYTTTHETEPSIVSRCRRYRVSSRSSWASL